MYSNKYPGPGPAPPLLDNNLAINTAQGAGGHQGRCPAEARPRTALHGVGLWASPRSQTPALTPADLRVPPPASPWLQPSAGQAGADQLCLDTPLSARRPTELDRG